MNLDGSGWIWVDLGGSGWIWVDLSGSGWIWMDLDGSGCIWVDLGGSERIWVDLMEEGGHLLKVSSLSARMLTFEKSSQKAWVFDTWSA